MRHYGLGFMERLNAAMAPRLATGGAVNGGSGESIRVEHVVGGQSYPSTMRGNDADAFLRALQSAKRRAQ